ncbi:protein LNK4 [Nicotiana tabacum]|uniref:Protein LNK4 n=1 Tax=Nicotiana tabacum TaxID=4097 RepID=A0A1S4AHE8_TOBAC|nr:PREDICTED: protein LNK4-like [Nicotiana tabacum]
MEWFSRVDVGDLVVPKGLEDGFPQSPDSWSQWDSTPFGNFKSEMKRNNIRSNVGSEDCKVTRSGVDMKNLGIHEENFDTLASQDSYCDMDQWSSYPPDQLDFHLDNLASMDQLDDVFLSSLLEECPTGMDASDESSDLSTNSQCSVLLADNQTGDEYSNPEHVTSNGCSAESAKYYYAHAFTSPMDWESQEINNSHLQEKAPTAEVAVKLEHDRGDSRVSDEDISTEQSVLQHLESLTAQLTEETRICFRDSLYRLADNSKHDECQSWNVQSDQSSSRLSKEETTELQTNVIDRTVANLLFSNIDFGASGGSSLDLTEVTDTRQHSGGMLWHIAVSQGCDVPTFGG